jgi:hypothetical protein
MATWELGNLVLVGLLPAEVQRWSFRTGQMSNPLPPHPDGKNLHLDMRIWRLKKRTGTSFSGTLMLGRADSNDVVIPHASVSKLHARLAADRQGRWTLTEAGSANGTNVDGQALASGQTAVLNPGTFLLLGGVAVSCLEPGTLVQALLARPAR